MLIRIDPLAMDDDTYKFPRRRNRRSGDVSAQNFLCGQCDRGYTRIENLMRHQRLECGKEPKYTCHICKKLFYRRYELKNHNQAKHTRLIEVIDEPEEPKYRRQKRSVYGDGWEKNWHTEVLCSIIVWSPIYVTFVFKKVNLRLKNQCSSRY